MAKKSKELIESALILLTTENKLDELLAQAKDILITPETLSVNYQFLLKLRAVYDAIAKKQKADMTDPKDEIKTIKSVYDPILKKIAEILNLHDPAIAALNADIKDAESVVISEISLGNKRVADYNTFVNKTTKDIVGAKTEDELTYIQKFIGLEKTRGKHYGEVVFEKVVEVADELLSLVQSQKNCIRENEKLIKQQAQAVVDGDIALAATLREQMEHKAQVIEENAITISEKAYKYVEAAQQESEEVVSGAITPRSRRWSYRVYDWDLFKKKMPEAVVISENKQILGKMAKEKGDAGEIPENKELQLNGVAFYRKLFYIGTETNTNAESE